MHSHSLSVSLSLLLLAFVIDGTYTIDNETISEDLREPRVYGRIVKLYSGTRAEPLYCASEGFQPDSINCAVFYRCVRGAHGKYTVFKYQCGPGTVYDPDKEVCNYPHNTKRLECGGRLASSTEQSRENEIHEVQPEIPSPITTKRQVYNDQMNLKDVTKLSTTYPGTTSIHRQTSDTPASSKSTAYPWVTPSSQTSTPLQQIYTTRQSTSQKGDACTSEGFMGDSENCRKFYRCVGNQRGNFIRYEFSCSESTIWDEDSQTCNHPWAVQRRRCGRGNSDNDQSSSPYKETTTNGPSQNTNVQHQLQVSYGSKSSQIQTQISKGSVIQNQTQINYGDRLEPTNSRHKQNQTQISYGSAASQSQTQIHYGNKGVQTQLQVDHTKQASQTQTQVYESSSKSTTTLIQQDEIDQGYGTQFDESHNEKENNNECSENGFIGDKNDCKKFYRCVNNGRGSYTKYQFSCGEGTVWDPKLDACNHVWAVKECGGKAPAQSSIQSESSPTTQSSTQNYFTSVSTTTEDEEDMPYGNQNQQPTSSSSTVQPKPAITTIESASASGTKCESSGFMGDPNDCKKFYRCVDNGRGSYTKYEFKCGEGTVWDSHIEACNHAWAVKECSSSQNANNIQTTTITDDSIMTTISLIQTTTQTPIQTDNYDPGYGEHQNELQSTTTTISKPSESNEHNENNKCKSSGFMGDNNDCKKFYRCVDNGNKSFTRYEFLCGEGTVWDSKIEACNHVWAVEKCGGDNMNHTQGENVEESSQQPNVDPTVQTTSTESSQQSTTTGKPVSVTECSEEGFIGDHNDCKKFYRCVDNGRGGFIKYDFTCGEGTVWDPEIVGCNHASSRLSCGKPENSDSFKEPDRESDEMFTENTVDTSTLSTSENETTSTSQKPPASTACKSEGFYGDLKDCKKFYRCVDNGKGSYTKYDFTCGDGTVWDQEIQACNHESSNSNCSKSSDSNIHSESEAETTENFTSVTTSNSEDKQTTQKNEATQSSSKDQCTSEGFFANSNDCKKFFRCVDNGNGGYTKYDFSCGEGTVWVQDLQTCDHDNDISNCNKQSDSTPHPISSNTYSDTTVTQSHKPDKEDDEYPNETSSKPTTDRDECSSEGFFGNNNDCKQFYRCVDNGKGGFTKYDFTCGEGTAWDSNIQTCNHIDEVKNCTKQQQNQHENEKPIMQDEEPPQTTDNNDPTKTTSSGSSTESTKPSNKDVCEKEGYYGNKQDCKKFYRCVDNGKGGLTKYDFTCGEGTIWDQDITTCNHPQDVTTPSCQQGGSSASATTSSSLDSTSTSDSSSHTTESNNQGNCSQEDSSKKPGNQNVTCDKAGFYANPNDCKKFYRCVDWDGDGKRFSVYHFDCGEGTIWDPALDTCNHEESVYPPRNCSGSQSQNENINQETTTTEQSTTTDTTTQQTTTQQTTTNEQTTEQTTTQQTDTNEQTTSQTTSSGQTAEQTTSSEPTTQQTTSSEQTTMQQTTTQQTTTSNQPTQQTTSQQPTTSEQTTTEQTTTEQITTEQTTTEQTTTEQTTTEQTTTEQTTTEQTTTEQTTAQQSTNAETITQQSTTDQTTTQQSTTDEQTTTQQSTDQNTTTNKSDEQSTTEQSTSSTENTTNESTTEQQTTTQTENEIEEMTSTTEATSETESGTNGSTTDENSTDSETTTESQEGTTESNSSSNEDCPKTEDDQHLYVCPTSFRRHPKYCNLFYQCDEDDESHEVKIAVFNCPNNTIYDESKTKCVEEGKADKKCDGEIAQRRRVKRLDTTYKEPIVVTKDSLKCPSVGYFQFEKEECSPAFLKCQKTKSGKLRGFVYKCPEGYVYWSVSKRCEATSNVRFCNKSYNDWRGRWEIPIERRNIGK